jgi:ribose-phosphate pyrophosphokinase
MITVNGSAIRPTLFPDGTSQVWKLDDGLLRPGTTAAVAWRFESEAEVMHLAQLAALLKAYELRATLDIRYLPYARQDKPVRNDRTFALHVFAPMLNAMGWEKVVLRDPHSPVARDLIERAVIRGFQDEALSAYQRTSSNLMCFPDDGARFKYSADFPNVPSVWAKKTRDQATGELGNASLTGDVANARILVVDDICDGGATFIRLASALRAGRAAKVCLFVSHGLFTKGTAVLFDAGIDRIFTPEGEVAR